MKTGLRLRVSLWFLWLASAAGTSFAKKAVPAPTKGRTPKAEFLSSPAGIPKLDRSKQQQAAMGGSTAIQAGGNVTVNQGMSLTQMAEVMREVGQITDRFTEEAMVKVDARMNEFRESVLMQFADTTKTDSEAFRDPDFQYTLGDAQKAYARSGDQAVRETLADIIARRSLAKSASREALTLNDAAKRAPLLTEAEFASLSLCYILKYTQYQGVASSAQLGKYLQTWIIPLAKKVSKEQSSFWHIEAQSCGNVGLGELTLTQLFRAHYIGPLGRGMPLEELQSTFSPETAIMLSHVVVKSEWDPRCVRPPTQNKEAYVQNYKGLGFTEPQLAEIWQRFEATFPPDVKSALTTIAPEIDVLFDVWESPLKSLTLNSVGIAIGHANAVRDVGLNAPLSIWIK